MKAFWITACWLGWLCSSGCWGIANAQTVDFNKAVIESKRSAPQIGTSATEQLPAETTKRLHDQYFNHLQWQSDFVQQSWGWHYYSTILLFVIVLSIVAFGLRITYLQFQRDYGLRRSRVGNRNSKPTDQNTQQAAQQQPQDLPGTTSNIKISAAGLELSSQIIGLFVLGFSLAFFYLYVKEVYPVQVLNPNQSESRGSASKANVNAVDQVGGAKSQP